jgi:Flp pilus assembly pilin Flp
MAKEILAKLKSEVGATAIEYGLIVAGIGAVLAATIFFIGDTIEATFQSILDVFAG